MRLGQKQDERQDPRDRLRDQCLELVAKRAGEAIQ